MFAFKSSPKNYLSLYYFIESLGAIVGLLISYNGCLFKCIASRRDISVEVDEEAIIYLVGTRVFVYLTKNYNAFIAA